MDGQKWRNWRKLYHRSLPFHGLRVDNHRPSSVFSLLASAQSMSVIGHRALFGAVSWHGRSSYLSYPYYQIPSWSSTYSPRLVSPYSRLCSRRRGGRPETGSLWRMCRSGPCRFRSNNAVILSTTHRHCCSNRHTCATQHHRALPSAALTPFPRCSDTL